MTKRVAYYLRLSTLRDGLKDLAEFPTDATDVKGAEERVLAAKLVVSLNTRLDSMYSGFSSSELHDVIKG